METQNSLFNETLSNLEIEARRDDRGYALIANFSEGFTVGWKMAIPEAFKEALDIKLTPRIFAGKKEMLWTQGRLYNFRQGDVLHDTRLAYGDWGKALKVLKLTVQVEFASPSGHIDYETFLVKDKSLEVSHQKGKGKAKNILVNGLNIKRQRIDHGIVRFKVYRPNGDKSALEEHETIECTQDDFIAFLQTGIVRSKDNKQLTLFA